MQSILIKTIVLFLLLVGYSSCTKIAEMDCAGRTDYSTNFTIDTNTAKNIANSICDQIKSDKIPGVQLSIIDNQEQVWTISTGSADAQRDIPLENYHQFRLASTTKTFIAALIYRLREEGKLDLDDKLSVYFPDFVNADLIRLENLLDHSSGLRDVLSLPDVLLTSTANTDKVWDPVKLAATILDKKLKFDPGSDHGYSNSNYLLLGLIAKEVGGLELDQLLFEKIFQPAGLQGISFQPIADAPKDLISGYDRQFIPVPGLYELTQENTSFASVAYASGNLVGNSADAGMFFHKLCTGKILSNDDFEDMIDFYKVDHPENEHLAFFGKGLFKYELNGEVLYGHEGQFIGFDNIIVHHPEKKMTISLLANVSTYKKFDLLTKILNEL